jgi:TrmH family RNA methyltransferase
MPQFIISSKDNPGIKEYKKLASSKKARDRGDCFVLEGLRLVTDALESGFEPKKIFLTEKNIERLNTLLPENKLICISEKVSEYVSETENSQGVFAVFHKPRRKKPEAVFEKADNIIILNELQDPGNMGTIIRTADALGMDAVVAVSSCEVFNPKVVRAAMGSVMRLTVLEMKDSGEVLELCRKNNIITGAAVLSSDSVALDKYSFSSKNAVWIGNEGNGLPETLANSCDKRLLIPMSGGAESLNAAVAASIFMWEMRRK